MPDWSWESDLAGMPWRQWFHFASCKVVPPVLNWFINHHSRLFGPVPFSGKPITTKDWDLVCTSNGCFCVWDGPGIRCCTIWGSNPSDRVHSWWYVNGGSCSIGLSCFGDESSSTAWTCDGVTLSDPLKGWPFDHLCYWCLLVVPRAWPTSQTVPQTFGIVCRIWRHGNWCHLSRGHTMGFSRQ